MKTPKKIARSAIRIIHTNLFPDADGEIRKSQKMFSTKHDSWHS